MANDHTITEKLHVTQYQTVTHTLILVKWQNTNFSHTRPTDISMGNRKKERERENMSPISCNGWIISVSLKEVAWIHSFSGCHHPLLNPHAPHHQVNDVTMVISSVRCSAPDYI
jgi:hypothetical protein